MKGFCPSFVTIEGGELRRGAGVSTGDAYTRKVAALPQPDISALQSSYNLLVGGVGGTGVVTVGALITMAAHLESKGASVLDFMGFAQKGGTVFSYVRPIQEAIKWQPIPGGVRRLPYFCSGCPHNSSTKVPEGSKAQAGIGCHFMASWMGRKTESLKSRPNR